MCTYFLIDYMYPRLSHVYLFLIQRIDFISLCISLCISDLMRTFLCISMYFFYFTHVLYVYISVSLIYVRIFLLSTFYLVYVLYNFYIYLFYALIIHISYVNTSTPLFRTDFLPISRILS